MNSAQIKIKLLRDIKTDALLIYIKTVIEELLKILIEIWPTFLIKNDPPAD